MTTDKLRAALESAAKSLVAVARMAAEEPTDSRPNIAAFATNRASVARAALADTEAPVDYRALAGELVAALRKVLETDIVLEETHGGLYQGDLDRMNIVRAALEKARQAGVIPFADGPTPETRKD